MMNDENLNLADIDQEQDLNEQKRIRREKLAKLQEMGRNPFVVENWDVTHHSGYIKENFEAMEGEKVSMAGRIMAKRQMGKASSSTSKIKKEEYRFMFARRYNQRGI